MKVLIAYYTKTGSTKAAADEIKSVLEASSFDVELKPFEACGNVADYDAVIVGTPINGMRIRPEALDFVNLNQQTLKKMPVAFYVMSYIYFQGSEFWKKRIGKSLNSAKRLVPPVSTEIFGGKVVEPLPGAMRAMFGISKDAPLDLQDFEKVRIWAKEIAEKMQ